MFSHFTKLVQDVKYFINKKIFPNTVKCIATPDADVLYIWTILLIIKFVNNKPCSVSFVFSMYCCPQEILLWGFVWKERLKESFRNDSLSHCVKNVCIRTYSFLHFPPFGLNTERYGVSLHVQSKCGKILRVRTPFTQCLCIRKNWINKNWSTRYC